MMTGTAASLLTLFEPEVASAIQDSDAPEAEIPNADLAIVSIAISLRRLADSLKLYLGERVSN